MTEYSNTAIVFGNLEEALLYFDYAIPVNFAHQMMMHETKMASMTPEDRFSSLKAMFDSLVASIPREIGSPLLPPALRADPQFLHALEELNAANFCMLNELIAIHLGLLPQVGKPEFGELACSRFNNLVTNFGLTSALIDVVGSLVVEEDTAESDIGVSLAGLNLIDVEHCSWIHIVEFRRDTEARDKMRSLRLFAYDNYTGRSREYIQDDILKRIADFNEAVRRWGFETRHGALTMLLNSKTLGEALTGSLISTLFGAPVPAVVTAVGGLAIEFGRVALEVTKQRFALRKLVAENAVSYITYARSKLKGDL